MSVNIDSQQDYRIDRHYVIQGLTVRYHNKNTALSTLGPPYPELTVKSSFCRMMTTDSGWHIQYRFDSQDQISTVSSG